MNQIASTPGLASWIQFPADSSLQIGAEKPADEVSEGAAHKVKQASGTVGYACPECARWSFFSGRYCDCGFKHF